jgi:hypothetical protein
MLGIVDSGEEGIFERRGRKGFAEGAEKTREKTLCARATELANPVRKPVLHFYWFLLRLLRNLRVLCVRYLSRLQDSR